jgi:AcrR family transcriptional regulator
VSTKQGRAKPLARDERRRAIVAAVIPLLVEKGAAATTAEMAQAAGIAEGTIFRAFPDKTALIHEAVKATMDAEPIRKALEAIPDTSPLEAQVTEAARILAARFEDITALVGVLRSLPQPLVNLHADAHQSAAEQMTAISTALTAVFERHRDRLVVDPARAATVLRGLIFSNVHPAIAIGERLSAGELVTILLSGIRVPTGSKN